MNKKLALLILILFCVISKDISAQNCFGCNIDFNCTSSPVYPTLCPSLLPDATAGVYYDEDITFYMPSQFTDNSTGITVDVNLEEVLVTGIAGLPFGIYYTLDSPSNTYFPAQSEYGCVKLCGTPLAQGNYNITVSVIANVTALGISMSENLSFNLTLAVYPGTSSNTSFTFSPTTGCDSVAIDFNALIDGSPAPTEHIWNFGNGNTSALSNPPTQYYYGAGTYPVTLETNIMEYVVTKVTASTSGSWYHEDLDDGVGIPWTTLWTATSDADLYFNITGGSSYYYSNTINNDNSPNWDNTNYTFNDPSISLQFWDDDDVSQDDEGGVALIQLNGPGAYNYITLGGWGTVSGTITVITQPSQSFNDYDSVMIFETPSPILNLDSTNFNISINDSTINSVTWFHNGIEVPYEINTTLENVSSGIYWAYVSTFFGCYGFSDTINIINCNYNFTPNILYSGHVLWTDSINHSLQWWGNGNPLLNSTNPTHYALTEGSYWVVSTDNYGCVSYSDTIIINFSSMEENSITKDLITIFPNPNNGNFNVTIKNNEIIDGVNIIITDVFGRKVLEKQNLTFSPNQFHPITINQFSKGIYLLYFNLNQKTFIKRVTIN